jgi:hypothetical protein
MSLNTKLHPAHPITFCNSICIGIKRDSINTQNISGVLKFAKLFASTAQNAWNSRGSVRLVFSGYADDSRELWEIPEVRAYVKKLVAAWPEWMFFLDTSDQTLQVCFMCLAQMARTADSSKQRIVGLTPEVLTDGFDGINQICDKYHFSDEVCEIASKKIADCFQVSTHGDTARSESDHSVFGGAA